MFREYKVRAFDLIKKNFGTIMGMSVVAMILSMQFISPEIAYDMMGNIVGINLRVLGITFYNILPNTASFDSFLLIFPIVSLIILFFLAIPISYGMEKYYLRVAKGDAKFDAAILFSAYKDGFGKIVCVNLLVGVITAIGTICFFIPGIIFSLMYLYVNLVMIKYPHLGIMDTLRKSASITRGFKMQLLWLSISFILWILLGGVTLGISNIFVNAYIGMSFVLVFNELERESNHVEL